jgi:hypothetical protein
VAAVEIKGSAGTVVNYGTLRGQVLVDSSVGRVSNLGAIQAANGVGVYLAAGTVTNGSSGVGDPLPEIRAIASWDFPPLNG